MNSKKRRQLAAILFIDLVGYTAMMQKNESESLAKLDRFTNKLQETVPDHGGKILNDYGDGCLCSFQSSVDAVKCALIIQLYLLDYDIYARIGIHIGDVIEQNGNIFGDGVNVASRIESIGVGGSILFSNQVAKYLKSHPNLISQSLGSFHFKNVDDPIEVFALTNDGLAVPDKNKIDGKLQIEKSRAPKSNSYFFLGFLIIAAILFFFYSSETQFDEPGWVPSDQKSIAVLPFANLESKESNDYFSEGMMEEILTQLQQINELKVKSRTSVMVYENVVKRPRRIGQELDVAYLLEGSVRRYDDFVKVKVSLLDVKDENNLWSNQYEGKIETSSILDFQNDIAEKIGISLKAEITPNEKAKIQKLATKSEAAYDFYLRGNYYFNRQTFFNETNSIKALAMYQAAVTEDSTFVLAHLAMAACHRYIYFYRFDVQENRILEAKEHLKIALSLDPELPEAMVEKAWQYYHFDRNYEEAISILVETKPKSPKDIHIYSGLGSCYKRQGFLEKSEQEYIQALTLDPGNRILLVNIAQATEHDRNYRKTIEYLDRLIAFEPENAVGYSLKARALINGSWDLQQASQLLANSSNERGFLNKLQKYRVLFGSRDYEAAIEFLNRTEESTFYDGQNDYIPIDLFYALCYRKLHDDSAQVDYALNGVKFLKQKIEQSPNDFRFVKALALCYALANEKSLALKYAKESIELMPTKKDILLHSFAQNALLEVYIINQQYDEAVNQIDRMMKMPGHLTTALLKNDPMYDELQGLLAFQKVIDRYDLKG